MSKELNRFEDDLRRLVRVVRRIPGPSPAKKIPKRLRDRYLKAINGDDNEAKDAAFKEIETFINEKLRSKK